MIKIENKVDILDLFNLLNVEYLYNYKYEIDLSNIKNCKLSDYYLDNEAEFIELTDKYGHSIINRDLVNVYISKTENKGYGLFSNEDIKKDSFIGVYLGIIKEEDEIVEFDESGYDTDYAWDYPDELEGLPLLEINAKYAGNELRFINHDKNPNIRVEHTVIGNEWYIFFIADRFIKKDEEFTISYGDAYWSTDYRELS